MLAVALSFAMSARAETFLEPIALPMGPSATVTLTDGSTLTGEPTIWAEGMGNVKKLNLVLPDGTKHKLAADQVSELRLTPNKLAKAAAAASGMSSIIDAGNADPNEVLDRSEVVYRAGVLPNGKPALLQLLNPGFDATIEVFPDPAGRETASMGVGGVAISGGEAKAYLARKVGTTETMLVKKGQYDELWDTLFGDCAEMPRPGEIDFVNMATDVANHGRACGAPAPAAP